jgi:hypothetical protein
MVVGPMTGACVRGRNPMVRHKARVRGGVRYALFITISSLAIISTETHRAYIIPSEEGAEWMERQRMDV